MKNDIPVITFDGTVGAGKGSIAQRLSLKLKWHYLDSGALYRVLALMAHRRYIEITDEQSLLDLIPEIHGECLPEIEADNTKVILNGENVSFAIRERFISDKSSRVAMLPKIREALVKVQRSFRQSPGLVTDGRDMGVTVFPDANVTLFLIASVEIRAKRRQQQLLRQGISATLRDLERDIALRDERDSKRKSSPLLKAEDAIEIDTGNLTIGGVMEEVWQRVQQKLQID